MSVPRQCSGPELHLEELLQLIQLKVAQFMPWDWNPSISREALVQEVVIRVLQRIGSHNPSLSRLMTFISRIVDSTLVDVWREVHAHKRCHQPFSHPPRGNCDRPVVDPPDPTKSQSTSNSDLQIDVQTEICKLPPELAPLAVDLLTLGVTEIAAKYAMHRGTVHRKLQKLRMHWKDSPLRSDLDHPGDN